MSKDEVLDLYLNRVYFGDGAYGIDAASQTYFGKPASQLTLIEAATLAGLPNAPTRLALTNDMPDAVARAHRILATMRGENWITDGDLTAALATQPVLTTAHNNEGDEAYVLDAAAVQAAQLAGGQAVDLVVRTTIDPALQTTATQAVRAVVLGEGRGRRVSQGALVSLAPDGAILAMVGGVDHDQSAFNRVTQAKRQPGSAFKAFVYGAAVEHGATEQTVRQDAPVSYGSWNPENYGGSYAGPVTLQQALARSLNTVSVRLTLEVGPDTVADFAHRLGVADVPDHPGPSIALGAYEVTPLELAAGYQVFQTGGGRTSPYLISEIRTTRGDVIWSHNASATTPVLDPLFATRMIHMLEAVVTSGTGVGANIGRPEAGKTGTSQDWRDAWFVGFTPDILTAVWVGNDGGRPMAKVTGGELPAEIWKRYMTVAEKNLPPRDFPWLVSEPNLPPQTLTMVDQGADQGAGQGADDGLLQDEPAMSGREDARAAEDAAAAGRSNADETGPRDVYAPTPRAGRYARQEEPYESGNPYARDPYARDPYAGDRYDEAQGDEADRPPPRSGRRAWPEPPPDDGEQGPPPRYQGRQPYSDADDARRDGY
jgi:penicillin-binding protein 1A